MPLDLPFIQPTSPPPANTRQTTFDQPLAINYADPAADGFSGRWIERKTGRAFTHKNFPGRQKPHVLVSIDHGEDRPLYHELTAEEFPRIFEKD